MTSDSSSKAAKAAAASSAPIQDRSLSAEEVRQHLTKAAEVLQGASRPAIQFVHWAFPHVAAFCRAAHAAYVRLPVDYAQFLIGAVFCFCGGLYPTLFAAIVAAEYGGRRTLVAALRDLTDEATKILEASKKDDELDEDGDGTRDVEQIDGKELLRRKARLVVTKMNPEKVNDALTSIYKVWLSVAAVLTVQFARTISMALGISEFLRRPIDRFVAPTIQAAVPDEYDKWVPVALGWFTKSVAMSIAWYIQTVVSAFTSALNGGLVMSRSLLRIGRSRGLSFVPARDEDTVADEVLSYAFAAAGFLFQFRLGFRVPFPFNVLLAPFEMAEYWIRWTITKAA